MNGGIGHQAASVMDGSGSHDTRRGYTWSWNHELTSLARGLAALMRSAYAIPSRLENALKGGDMRQQILRVMASFSIAASVLGGPAFVQAQSSYPLKSADFFNPHNVNTKNPTSSSARFYLMLNGNNGNISFDERSFPQYNAVTFYVGAKDASTIESRAQVQVLGDGHPIKSITLTSPSASNPITVRITGYRIITFARVSVNGDNYLYIGAPTLVHVGPPAPLAPTIVLANNVVQSGGSQTIDVATLANRWVTILVVYANGIHMVIGPRQSGPTGHYIYTFTLPDGVSGTAQVVAVVSSIGVAQTTFAVSQG